MVTRAAWVALGDQEMEGPSGCAAGDLGAVCHGVQGGH
jgi:hypothetical protein